MHPACPRLLPLSAACCAALLLVLPAQAAAADTRPQAKAAAARPAPKPATPRQQLKSEAKGLALAAETVEAISEAQLAVASRVLTGAADCEFNQQINVQPLNGVPGYFTVSHKGKRYRMLPRETATGAVRLEDPAAGIVWLQIPTKSMLMNARVGQRLVDSCLHTAQRTAANAAVEAGQGIGIVAPVAPAAAAVPVASVVPVVSVTSIVPVAAEASVTPAAATPVAPMVAIERPAAAAESPAAASAPLTR